LVLASKYAAFPSSRILIKPIAPVIRRGLPRKLLLGDLQALFSGTHFGKFPKGVQVCRAAFKKGLSPVLRTFNETGGEYIFWGVELLQKGEKRESSSFFTSCGSATFGEDCLTKKRCSRGHYGGVTLSPLRRNHGDKHTRGVL